MLTRRDYLMRYIDQLGEYLQRLTAGQRDAELDDTIADAIGLRLGELEDLPEEFLMSRLATHGDDDGGRQRAMIASELALTLGAVRAEELRPIGAAFLFERAARLLDWAMGGDLSLFEARLRPHLDALARALRGNPEVEEAALASTLRRAEEAGAYAVAEDLLFELAAGGWPEAPAVGEAFYRRLATVEPEALSAGGLEASDLADDLAELRRRCTLCPLPAAQG